MSQIITITGPMGSGKSTLGRALSKQLGFHFIEEEFRDNPYLKDATTRGTHKYENIQWFIQSDFKRYVHACQLSDQGQGVIVDKPFFEEFTYIAMSGLKNEEMSECNRLVDEMFQQVRPPDLAIDLKIRTPELTARIASRGREFEGSISQEWLEQFRRTHEAQLYRIDGIRRLPLNAEAFDFRDPQQVETIVRLITETFECPL